MFIRTNITILTLVITLMSMSLTQTSYGAARAKKVEKRATRGIDADVVAEAPDASEKDTSDDTPDETPETSDTKGTEETKDIAPTPDVLDTIIHAKPLPDRHHQESAPGFIEEHQQLISMLRSLLHIPYIVTIDSQDAQKISTSALLSALATDSQLLYELLRKHKDTCALKILAWDLPKICGYGAGAVYEYGRFVKAAEIAEKNKVFNKQLRNLKIQQTIQLFLELCLRGLVYKVSLSNPHQKETLKPIGEIADIIELWRLLGRYNTFLIESEQPVQVIPIQTTTEEPAIAS